MSNYRLSVGRDSFELVDTRNGFILARGRIDSCGTTRGIELAPEVLKSNPQRLAVLKAIGDNSRESVLNRAMAYYRAEMDAAKQLGKLAHIEELALWAHAAIERRHFSVALA